MHPNKKEFTWSKRTQKIFLAKRLDFIFTSESLLPFYRDSDICSFGFSDHRVCVLNLDFSTFNRGPSVYKFNVSLLRNKSFIDEVVLEINRIKTLDLDPHLTWEYIKAVIRDKGMAYGRSIAHLKRLEKENLNNQIKRLENSIISSPTDDLLKNYTELKLKLEIFEVNEAEGARIRAGQKWAQEGERCTKFFLGLEKQRSNNNTLFCVENNNETRSQVTDPLLILDQIKNHFETIYSSSSSGNVCSTYDDIFVSSEGAGILDDYDKSILNKSLSETEILNALKHSNNNSAPGLDGLPCELYKVLWKDIKDPLLASFNFSFAMGTLSFSQRSSLICLHHKGKELPREKIENWRPISLTNADYKLITKALARRLNTCLDKCIEKDQFSFIKGRQISDLLRQLDDILEHGKSHFPDSIILSLDYAKAFDTISIASIRKALCFFEFGSEFTKWIDIILKDRLSCVRNGGYVSDFFKMERGVRQGCPISPLLFIITLELLARDIRKNENIKGIRIYPDSEPIKIKLYADDATLFLKDITDYREVLSRIKLFSYFSGLCLNKRKSSAMYIGNATRAGQILCGIKFVNKLKILGLTFSNEKTASSIDENFAPRIEKLERVCSLWSKRKLTLIGKITILKTFGISQFIYIMQSIGISEPNLTKINKIMFNFIWGPSGENDKKIIEKVKREIMCSKYEEGGLNMIDIFKMQNSFLLKWADSLLKSSENPINQSWQTIPLYCFIPVGGLSVFKCSVKGSDFKGLRLIRSTFWRRVLKTWLDNNTSDVEPPFNVLDPIFNNSAVKFKKSPIFIETCIRRNMIYINDFIEDGEIICFDTFKSRFGMTAETHLAYNIIFNALKKVEGDIKSSLEILPTQISTNKYLFQELETGCISRKNYYNLINKKVTVSVKKTFRDMYQIEEHNTDVWYSALQSTSEVKLIQLQWKILHNIYPTGVLLHKMKKRPSDQCEFCDQQDTLVHFFVSCPVSRELWNEAETILARKLDTLFKLDERSILFGLSDDISISNGYSAFVNLVCLIGKQTISSFKYDKCVGKIAFWFEKQLSLRDIH